jgi:hypothetical protein
LESKGRVDEKHSQPPERRDKSAPEERVLTSLYPLVEPGDLAGKPTENHAMAKADAENQILANRRESEQEVHPASSLSPRLPEGRRARGEYRSEPPQRLEQKTEIYISIGSIELRAPRAETKPAAAPFRPRVTLEDFLRRKPEAGA